jgi:hypothetical protein
MKRQHHWHPENLIQMGHSGKEMDMEKSGIARGLGKSLDQGELEN